jgi:hypothetical protein
MGNGRAGFQPQFQVIFLPNSPIELLPAPHAAGHAGLLSRAVYRSCPRKTFTGMNLGTAAVGLAAHLLAITSLLAFSLLVFRWHLLIFHVLFRFLVDVFRAGTTGTNTD